MDQKTLKSLVEYSPITGIFRWAISRPGCRKGDICGRLSAHGYIEIGLLGRLWKAQRLAAIYMTGEMPENGVDHIDGDRYNNRWSNLRLCTQSQNMGNVGVRKNNTSGHPGVTFDKARGKWRAQIRLAGTKTNLGRFESFNDAVAAHNKAHMKNFGEFSPYQASAVDD